MAEYFIILDGTIYAVAYDYYEAHAILTEACELGHAWMEVK